MKMSKSYLITLLNYISNVYELGEKIKALSNTRANSKISTSAIAMVVLIGFMLKIRSFNQLDDWLENGDLNNCEGVP